MKLDRKKILTAILSLVLMFVFWPLVCGIIRIGIIVAILGAVYLLIRGKKP